MTDMMQNLKKGGGDKPPIGLVYGRPGVGKTTFGTFAPGCIFVQTEDGLTDPKLSHVPTFGVMTSYEDVLSAYEAVCNNCVEQGWNTIVLDSIDRLNPLIIDYVCRANGWKKLEDGAYGKGKVAYVDEWRNHMSTMMEIRKHFGLGFLLLGHHKAVKVAPPDSDPFTQYSLTLPDEVSRILIGDCDFVLFATYPTHTISSSEQGFGKKTTRAVTERPVFFTAENGARVAKNRYGMPEKLPLSWESVAQYIPHWAQSMNHDENAA
jgi:hypothetical protein